MKYNKWKEANDYWRMVISKPFKVKGRNVMLLNYIENYYSRQNRSNYVTKTMHRFINYLNNISNEIYSCVTALNLDAYNLLYVDSYKKDLIGINPYISITYGQINAIGKSNPYISITYGQINAIGKFMDAFEFYNRVRYNGDKLRKSIVNNLLDAIDRISPLQDILRQHKYNKTHKRKHPFPIISDNFLEHNGHLHTQYYDNYKKLCSDCLRRKIDITKTFYRYHSSLDVNNIFNKRNT